MVLRPPSVGELRDAYRFPGFTPSRTVLGVAGASDARVVGLNRREKKHAVAPAARRTEFADLIECHWDGIAAYCQPKNKVALGFVEGLNNKIRVIQRRCYGLRDEDHLHLKILTCTLPPLPKT